MGYNSIYNLVYLFGCRSHKTLSLPIVVYIERESERENVASIWLENIQNAYKARLDLHHTYGRNTCTMPFW